MCCTASGKGAKRVLSVACSGFENSGKCVQAQGAELLLFTSRLDVGYISSM